MATLSNYLFATGALLLLFAFVLGVAYTTMLAAGRRASGSTAGRHRAARHGGSDGGAPALARYRRRFPARSTVGRHRPWPHLGQLPAHGRVAC